MCHEKIEAFDIPDAWYKTLKLIWTKGIDFKVGYGSEQTLTKKLNLTLEIQHPETRPLLHEKAPNDKEYLNWYAGTYLWYPEPDNAEYTYGNRLRKPVDQLQTVIDRLKEQPMDRQCTAIVRRPEDIVKGKCKDPPCLTVLDFEIMNDKLQTTGYFRSWDAYAGLPCNLGGIQMVCEFMAEEIGIKSGPLIMHSKNCHIYERQFPLVKDLLEPRKEDKKNGNN
jgi:thymidylate synthase